MNETSWSQTAKTSTFEPDSWRGKNGGWVKATITLKSWFMRMLALIMANQYATQQRKTPKVY